MAGGRCSLLSLVMVLAVLSEAVAEPIQIGSRRELLVDHSLIDQIRGDAKLHLHQPRPQEVVLVADEPWEGNTSAYFTIFQDGALYRMYYRGSHYDEKARQSAHPEVTCYAESKDGIHWVKPRFGLFEFNGSKQNNIVWDGIGTHNFTPFLDRSPDCPPKSRYKAFGGGRPKGRQGLYAFQSADGIRWTMIRDEPVITNGAFDSQNLAFWDAHARVYREYHRAFRGVRDIMTGTSNDFLRWSDPVFLDYPGAPKEHLYTNAIRPYERAPHILIGFPTRFHPERGSQVEPTFMASRDGRTFHRWTESVIPVTAPQDRDGNRSNYMTWGLVQLPGNEKEYSVYATEAYYTGKGSRVRRFTYRVDGFVSLRAGADGGELLTKPLIFNGNQLTVNFVTSPQGSMRVELQDTDGKSLKSFALSDCHKMRGDAIDAPVTWKIGTDVSDPAAKPIRLRFQLHDADLFAFRFK